MRLTAMLLLFGLTSACKGRDPVDTGDTADTGTPLPELDAALVDSLTGTLESGRADNGVLGMTLALSVPGHQPLVVSVGDADLAGTPLDPSDRFRIASVTKTFTAALVLQLVDEGVLALDDPLADYNTQLANDPGITLRQLLDHTAGVPEYFGASGFTTPTEPWTDAALVDLVADDALLFTPGSSWSYSNTHYVLLALVAEAATGVSYAEHLETRFFGPLGLDGIELPEADWGDVSPSFIGSTDYSDGMHPTAASAAGAITASAADLAAWGQAFGDGSLLSADTFSAQVGDPVEISAGFIWYGLGTMIMGDGLDDPELELGHNGALIGSASWMGHRPERGATMVIFGNTWPQVGGSYDYQYPLVLSWDLWDRVEEAMPLE